MPVSKLTLASGTVTSAGAETGVAVGSITGDYTIKFILQSFSLPGASARISVEESADGSFASPKQLWIQNFSGGSIPIEGLMTSFKKYQACGTDLVGASGAYLRVNIQELNGMEGLVSISFDCWIEF